MKIDRGLFKIEKSISIYTGLYVLVAASIVPLVFLADTPLMLAIAINIATAIGVYTFISISNVSYEERKALMESDIKSLERSPAAGTSEQKKEGSTGLSGVLNEVLVRAEETLDSIDKNFTKATEAFKGNSEALLANLNNEDKELTAVFFADYRDKAMKESSKSIEDMLAVLKDIRLKNIDYSSNMISLDTKLEDIVNIGTEVMCIADWGNMLVVSKAFEDSKSGRYGGEMSLLAEELGALVAKSISASERMNLSVQDIKKLTEVNLKNLNDDMTYKNAALGKLEGSIKENFSSSNETIKYLGDTLQGIEGDYLVSDAAFFDKVAEKKFLEVVRPLKRLKESLVEFSTATKSVSISEKVGDMKLVGSNTKDVSARLKILG